MKPSMVLDAFALPPEKAIEFLQKKGDALSWDWTDVWQEQHARAFTVAKCTRMDVLQDIRGELQKAIEGGLPFKEFKKNLTPMLKAKGWWGKQTITGPDGTEQKVQLGSPYRLRTIYQTNMQSALMAGRWQGHEETALDRPYLEYIAVLDSRTRPTHKALHGLVFRIDDPFWNTHYPPLDWNCFTPDTLIAAPTRWKPICSFKSGDKIIGGSGEIDTVDAVHSRYYKGTMLRITSEDTGSITTTPDHRILTTRGWIHAKNLSVGDKLVDISKLFQFNDAIHDVDDSHSLFTQDSMAFPIKRDSSIASNLDCQAEIRNHNIDPIRMNTGIKCHIISKTLQVRNKSFFYPSWFKPIIRMALRFCYIQNFPSLCRFSLNVWSRTRRNLRQLCSHCSHPRAIFFSHKLSNMRSFFCFFLVKIHERFSLIFSSRNIADPLGFNSVATMPRRYAEIRDKINQSVIPNTPSCADFPVTHQLLDIESPEGFVGGAPLDLFDSLQSFESWSRSHNVLLVVKAIDKIYYTGNVFNLSVNRDETYCTKIAVVHNCRCRTRSRSERELKREGITPISSDGSMSTKEVLVSKKTGLTEEVNGFKAPNGTTVWTGPGFNYNVGKAGFIPDERKYDKDILSQYSQIVNRNGAARQTLITDLQEVNDVMMDWAKENKWAFPRGYKFVNIGSEDNGIAWTDSKGGIHISDLYHTDKDGKDYLPIVELRDAFANIYKGKALTFNQEYMVETLWHEIMHNRAKGATKIFPEHVKFPMETLNQWVARRTYPRFIRSLGAEPIHQQEILKKGYGYGWCIENLSLLLKEIGLEEETLLRPFQSLLLRSPYETIDIAWANLLAGMSGKSQDKIMSAIADLRLKKAAFSEKLIGLKLNEATR
jgi:SPP1 gp7 family putative phage head morphogenesis protein